MFDGYHCGKDNIKAFPFDPKQFPSNLIPDIKIIVDKLMRSLKENSERKYVYYKGSGDVEYDEFNVKRSKSILDEIDHIFAKHYSFTDEELDFIINYDIKYRMGAEAEN
jgi:hypothetical protein